MSELLTGEDIRSLLQEVAEELDDDTTRTLIMAGGSLLAWHGLRDSTHDVDTIALLDDDLRRAVAVVGARHGLAAHWLNDRARPFAPATLVLADCPVLMDHPALRVLGVPLEQLFLMKLDAARVRSADFGDMLRLWPLCAFRDEHEVVARYYEAYPNAIEDEFLGDYVAGIARLSTGGR